MEFKYTVNYEDFGKAAKLLFFCYTVVMSHSRANNIYIFNYFIMPKNFCSKLPSLCGIVSLRVTCLMSHSRGYNNCNQSLVYSCHVWSNANITSMVLLIRKSHTMLIVLTKIVVVQWFQIALFLIKQSYLSCQMWYWDWFFPLQLQLTVCYALLP